MFLKDDKTVACRKTLYQRVLIRRINCCHPQDPVQSYFDMKEELLPYNTSLEDIYNSNKDCALYIDKERDLHPIDLMARRSANQTCLKGTAPLQ